MAVSDERKKYNKMENILQSINQKHISLSEDEIKTNNQILEQVSALLFFNML